MFPLPHKKLSKEQETTWRRLQTNLFLNSVVHSRMFPTQFLPSCTLCDERATPNQILWGWKEDLSPLELGEVLFPDYWEALMRSSDPDTQEQVVKRSLEVASRLDLLAI
ncbi:hypothetical protein HPB50_025527 [Hyalomma asiaticum]|uniref:Uncharacterized protein n=1 Tax=Hyalomma asiaticum TaxID=266040 RepID=A0ACB7SSR3_HYAAI|nr:hypothetical protein HPB50_025527 [Hyalomma asiaticum]